MRAAVAGDTGMAGDTLGFAELIDLREEYRGRTVEIKQVKVYYRGLTQDALLRMGHSYASACAPR